MGRGPWYQSDLYLNVYRAALKNIYKSDEA